MRTKRNLWRHAIWIAALLPVVATGGVFADQMMEAAPADLDLALSKATDAGLYVSTIAPADGDATIGPLHAWTVTVTTPDGAPVEGAQIGFDGQMPQHGHRLPTAPQMTETLGSGQYLVEGVRFNMPGWWTISITIDAAAGDDEATYNVVL